MKFNCHAKLETKMRPSIFMMIQCIHGEFSHLLLLFSVWIFPNFFNFWKVGNVCWKITNFSQFFHQKQISQNRENFATNKKKTTEITGRKLGTILSPTYIYGDVPTLKTSEQALWKGPLKRGLPCQNRPLHFCSTIFVWISGRVFFLFSPNFVRQVVWQSSKFGDRSETKKWQNLQIL